jgi:hypothetical protein
LSLRFRRVRTGDAANIGAAPKGHVEDLLKRLERESHGIDAASLPQPSGIDKCRFSSRRTPI